MFEEFPDNLYTRDAYDKILIQLHEEIPNQIEGLTNLSYTLTYGSQERLSGFPIESICQEIIHLLETTESENVAQLSSSCVFSVLEAHSRSTSSLMQADALRVLAAHLMNIKWVETSQNCIKALNVISLYQAQQIGRRIGLDPLLSNIDLFSPMIQREAVSAAQRITENIVESKYATHLAKLISLSKSQDSKISSTSIKTIDNIASHVSPEFVTADVITSLCSSSQFLKALINLSVHPTHIARIIESDVDFEAFFKEAKNADSQKSVLKLILNLLPPTRVLNQFNLPKHQRPADQSKQFAIKIQPLLLKLLMENSLSLKYILMCFASTLSIQKVELTEELMVVLKGFGKSPDLSAYVLAVLTFYETSPLLVESQILDVLTNINLSGQQKNWFTRNINRIRKKVNQHSKNQLKLDNLSVDEIIDLIKQDVSKFEFLSSGVKRCNELFKSDVTLSESDAAILSEYILSLLPYVTLPTISDLNTIDNFLNGLEKQILIPITIPVSPETLMLKVSKFEIVGYLEAWFNCEYSQYNIPKLLQLMAKRPELKDLILSESQKKVTFGQLSVFFRALDDEYPRYHLKDVINNQTYNSSSSFFNVTSDEDRFSGTTHKFKLVSGDSAENLPTTYKTYDSLLEVLNILEHLSKITKIVPNPNFSRKIHNLLANPYDTLYHTSLALNTVFAHPYLFPFETRLLAFKLMAFEPRSALKTLMKEFNVIGQNISSEPLKVTVHRDSIFNDGFWLISKLCQNMLKFEVSFAGEKGIGLGPTHEFFTLFSHQLCIGGRRLFRSERYKYDEYTIDKNGMFFSPNATPKAAKLLGSFLAKAIQMECLIDINFNPAIFKLIRGKLLTVQDVDPVLHQSLEHPAGLVGLTFVYPGVDIPLKENGEDIDVTPTNVTEFVDLIKDFTCGQNHMKPIVDAFIEGFDSVFPFKYLDVFEESEIGRLLTGDAPQITIDDLKNNVEISHGYQPDSNEIKMLYEIIAEMSKDEQRLLIEFITGYTQLPIGGLSALEPKLTIAKKDEGKTHDHTLPSVMTCMNYFKVPPYSSKNIMRERIIIAINEGRNSFEMT